MGYVGETIWDYKNQIPSAFIVYLILPVEYMFWCSD